VTWTLQVYIYVGGATRDITAMDRIERDIAAYRTNDSGAVSKGDGFQFQSVWT
jgi:hypothetical protein